MSETKLTLREAMKQAVAAHNAGALAKAERLYRAVLAAKPNHANALQLLGLVESQRGHNENALRLFDRSLGIRPDHFDALYNCAAAYFELNRIKEALDCYRQALAIKADPVCHSNLIFVMNFDGEASAAEQHAERARWNMLYARALAPRIASHANEPDPNRRLRIGYVSSHFRSQAATYGFGGAIVCHNKSRFEVVCYSDTRKEGEVTARLRAHADIWRHTAGLSDEDLAKLIRADEIDILVDCVGHMSNNRLLTFARKPAPIQVTAWGEPAGTGLKTMDYLFADPVLVPESERPLLAERVFDLPNFLGYWQPDDVPEPPPLPALARGYVTFGSFNRPNKIQDPVLRCWAAVLRALPTARLVLKSAGPSVDVSHPARIRRVLESEGIDTERVTLVGRTKRHEHFAAYREIDIALDPFPHGGGMTTLDAIWMGVPVVTWRGGTISSRLAAASLTALGLGDFIASDAEGYVALAVGKASGLKALAKTRAGLREKMAHSAVGDQNLYARAVEAAYVAMWREWCAGDRA